MDFNTFTATIPSEEYRQLIEENKDLKSLKNDLLDEVEDFKKKYESLQGAIAKNIKENKRYHFENIKIRNCEIVKEYHYENIVKAFNELGIYDEFYINNEIIDFLVNKSESEGGINA